MSSSKLPNYKNMIFVGDGLHKTKKDIQISRQIANLPFQHNTYYFRASALVRMNELLLAYIFDLLLKRVFKSFAKICSLTEKKSSKAVQLSHAQGKREHLNIHQNRGTFAVNGEAHFHVSIDHNKISETLLLHVV